MPAGLESLPQDTIDMAVQLKSILSHLKERVDVLRAASRHAHVEVEILARLYDSQATPKRARSRQTRPRVNAVCPRSRCQTPPRSRAALPRGSCRCKRG